jgi:RHS repeat-associated protein
VRHRGCGALVNATGVFMQNRARSLPAFALWIALAALQLLFIAPAHADYIGGQVPRCDICLACERSCVQCQACPGCQQQPICPAMYVPGSAAISLTEGNLQKQYSVVRLKSALGPTIDFSLTYNSYNADASQSQVDTGLGYGWTHSYNVFLFTQRGHVFRMGADGRVTRYSLGPNGTYTAPPGYFETLVRNSDGSFTLRKKDGAVFLFTLVPDTAFVVGGPVYRLRMLVDRNGNAVTLDYANGNLVLITDTFGRRLTLEYDTRHKLTAVRVTATPLRVTRLQYDPTGRQLVGITDPAGLTTRYQYNALYQLVGEVDRDGRRLSYLYQSGKPVSIIDGAGAALLRLSNPVNWAIDATALARDLLRTYRPSTTTLVDGRGNVWKYDYDARGYVTRIVAPDSAQTTFTYDSATLRLASTTDANGHVTRYAYDTRGNLTELVDALGNRSAYAYEPTFSMRTQATDANGHVTRYEYDSRGNRVREVDAIGNSGRWTYDSHGNVTTETNRNGNVTTYQYDAGGNRIRTTNGAGDLTRYSYDAVGNTITRTMPNGNVITYTYDVRDLLIRVDDGIGSVARYTYDGEGNRLTNTDGNGNGSRFVYDLRQRLVQTIDALGLPASQVYDGNDNRISRTDRNGHPTRYTYDVQNRLVAIEDARGGITRAEYDAVGNLIRVADAKPPPLTGITTYTYDAVNRLISETLPNPAPNTRTYTYDAVGNLISRTDPIGQTTNYTYDALDRLTRRSYPISPPDHFSFDAGGRLRTAERGGWLVTFDYDAADRLVHTTQNGRTISYSYDVPGRTRTIVYPGGRAIVELTDLRSRLATVDDGAVTPIVRYAYDLANRVGTRTYRNGVVASYTYNANDWMVTVDHLRGATRVAGFEYTFDNEANRLSERNRLDAQGSEAYRYDAIDRLIDYRVGTLVGSSVPVPATQTQYALDPVGNWNSRTKDGVTETRAHNEANELVLIAGSPLSYDGNGNLAEDTRYRYAYDEENRVVGVTRNADGILVGSYRYDALGRRVVKIANAAAGSPAETRYFHDDVRILEEQTPAGTSLATYVYGNYVDEMLAMDRVGTFYYHQDSLWSVGAITNAAGDVVERYRYDAYGCADVRDAAGGSVPPNAWGTPRSVIGNGFTFTGRQLDEETGLYYYRARYYDCFKGRFLQRDPLGYVNGMNLYEYVGSNPINRLDPLGLAWYGNWCGPGGGPAAPIDALDTCCQAHDICYGICGVAGVWGVIGPNACARACDRTLCICAATANCGWGLWCNAFRRGVLDIFCCNGFGRIF